MKDYICPKCQGHLSIDNEIIFLTKNNKGDSAIVLLSAELGDYSFRKNPNVDFAEGDHVNFICPICYENLNADNIDDNLAQITMVDEAGVQHDIIFSKVLGEKCTYALSDKGMDSFGDHKENYMGKM
jgi:hypothetical protein